MLLLWRAVVLRIPWCVRPLFAAVSFPTSGGCELTCCCECNGFCEGSRACCCSDCRWCCSCPGACTPRFSVSPVLTGGLRAQCSKHVCFWGNRRCCVRCCNPNVAGGFCPVGFECACCWEFQ